MVGSGCGHAVVRLDERRVMVCEGCGQVWTLSARPLPRALSADAVARVGLVSASWLVPPRP